MSTVSEFQVARGAAPTAYGGSPEVFLAKRSESQRLAPTQGSKTPSPDAVIGASACTALKAWRAMVNKPLFLLILDTSGGTQCGGSAPSTVTNHA